MYHQLFLIALSLVATANCILCNGNGFYSKAYYISTAGVCKGSCVYRTGTHGGVSSEEVRSLYRCCPGYENVKAYPNNIYNRQRKCVKATPTAAPTTAPTTAPVVIEEGSAADTNETDSTEAPSVNPTQAPTAKPTEFPAQGSKCTRHDRAKNRYVNTPAGSLCKITCLRCKGKDGASYDCKAKKRYRCCNGYTYQVVNIYSGQRTCVKN